mmetsp:Transcript_18939/g.44015  ORF Transcript_18939/g.44015 Transcript_18939/m.44015 type:complete len:363 (-) Transcript_18939:26-1114(-)
MGGSWPAVRQAVKRVDYVSFNLLFIPAMSVGGLLLLSLLSLPRPRSPPPRPRGPGDYLGLFEALEDQTNWETSMSLFMSAGAGACVATSNFMLSGAMSYAGLTRSLPVFNGMAIFVGVTVNYFIEGNAHPGSLVGGVLCIFAAIFLTFLSRQQASEPAPPGSPKLPAAVGVMSFNNLADAMKVTTGVESSGSRGEKGALSVDGRQHSGYTAVAVNGSDEGSSAQDDAANVLLGLVLSAAAGCIDGCWSSLTLTAKLNGVDNYVTASYFCMGLLVPLVVIEPIIYLRDPVTWLANVRSVTMFEWSLVALSGFLNIFAIITYFMATVVISSAVAFAIFLSTPLVSIALGAFVLRELDNEPLGAH